MTTKIKANAGMRAYAATRIKHAIELGRTDRDLDLLLGQVLCDLDAEIGPLCEIEGCTDAADAEATFRERDESDPEEEVLTVCYRHQEAHRTAKPGRTIWGSRSLY